MKTARAIGTQAPGLAATSTRWRTDGARPPVSRHWQEEETMIKHRPRWATVAQGQQARRGPCRGEAVSADAGMREDDR
jgi:hypothetical protein